MASVNIFRAGRSAALTNPTADTVFLNPLISTAPLIVKMPLLGLGTTSSAQWIVRAWGRATGGTTTNFTIKIQQGTSTTAGSNTTVFAGGARAYNSASANWRVEVNFVWDATSQVITASGVEHGGATIGGAFATGTSTTSQNLATTNASYVLAGIFSATNAGNTVTVDGLELEMVGVPSGE